MRVNFATVLKALSALPLLAASSISIQGQDAESLHRGGQLEERRNHAADSGDDAPHSGSRQGYGHVRQGNTSSGRDAWGRPYAPYGPESAKDLLDRSRDSYQLPSWELGIDLMEPRPIEVMGPDGPKVVWYVLYKVTNKNMQAVRKYETFLSEVATPGVGTTTVESAGYNTAGVGEVSSGGGTPRMISRAFLDPQVKDDGEMVGMPVNTSLGVRVETVNGFDALAGNANDLRVQIEAEVDRLIGSGEIDQSRRQQMIDARMESVRKIYRDSGDPELVSMIARKEGLMEWRGFKLEPVLASSSAFQRDVSAEYNLISDFLGGPIALPVVRHTLGNDGSVGTVTVYPAVYEDGAFAGWSDQELPGETTLVRESHPLFGKLLKVRYQEYDVVDRFGTILGPDDAGYMRARAAGGEILRDKPNQGVAGNLTDLIGTPAKRPAYRIYQPGDKILHGYSTGVPTAQGSSDTFRIYGKIVESEHAAAAVASALAELANSTLDARDGNSGGADLDRVAGADFRAAAQAAAGSAIRELDFGTEMWGRQPVGEQIPVKQLDHLGRPIRRGLVTYKVGERVTEAEYRAWAQRMPSAALSGRDPRPWTRPLRADDLLVGLPKIKMGKLLDDEKGAAETVTVNGRSVATGRIYDSRVIAPEDFARDPDGSYFSNRIAPVDSSAQLQVGEAYAYAPLGPAAEGATPVPAFDRLGVWADYVDPVSGQRIPLRDADGNVVVDEMGQTLYVKDFEYEWLYAYELVREDETDSNFGAAFGNTPRGYDMTEIPAFIHDGKVVGIATWEIWRDGPEGRSLVRLSWAASTTPGEISLRPEEVAEQRGYTVGTARVPTYVANALRRSLEEGDSVVPDEVLAPRFFIRDGQFRNSWQGGETVATSQRWTLPAPLVHSNENNEWVAESSLKLTIGPDGERVHEHFISERWGVIILKDVDPEWDFMNVSIRGLRSPMIRRGFEAERFNLEPLADGGQGVARVGLGPRWVRQDWVYQARFERQGNDREPTTNMITKVSEGWRLMEEQEVK
jgi:hypothetical protein